MSRRAAIITLVVLALLAALGYWIAQHVEKREIKIPIGLHGEARRNPLLGAQRYLTQMGIAVERLEDARRMLTDPAAEDVLIITSDRQTLGQARTQALLEWVERGGHLIVTVPHMAARIKDAAHQPSAPRDPLLAALGLGLARASYAGQEDAEYADGEDEAMADEAADNADAADNQDATDSEAGSCPEDGGCSEEDYTEEDYTEVRLPAASQVLQADLSQYTVLTGEKNTDTVARHAGGVALVSRSLGRGHIVVLTDLDIFQFRAIGELDHALLLWHLVKDAGKVWFVTDNDMPPIWLWLWRHAMETLTAAFLFLSLWLWSRSARFGPLVTEPAPERRRILEHIEAAGRFLWQHQRQERLLKSVRDALAATAARRHPAWVGMSEAEKTGHLASLSGRGEEELRELLHAATTHRRQDFFHVIRKLETIRKKL
jgi:hypothetical protein